MHVMPVMLDAQINIGAAGAVSSIAGPLVSSVEHMSTGIYKINLQNNFNGLFNAQASVSSPAAGLSGILAIEIANAQNSAVQSSSAPSVTIKCLDAAGALADPANGSSVSVTMFLNNSSVRIQGE